MTKLINRLTATHNGIVCMNDFKNDKCVLSMIIKIITVKLVFKSHLIDLYAKNHSSALNFTHKILCTT
jgi:hypothetical protein